MESWEEEFFEDKEMMKVFQSLMHSPKSAKQISRECHIPLKSVQQKIKELKEKRLLEISESIYDYNDKNHLFKRLDKIRHNQHLPQNFHCYQ